MKVYHILTVLVILLTIVFLSLFWKDQQKDKSDSVDNKLSEQEITEILAKDEKITNKSSIRTAHTPNVVCPSKKEKFHILLRQAQQHIDTKNWKQLSQLTRNFDELLEEEDFDNILAWLSEVASVQKNQGVYSVITAPKDTVLIQYIIGHQGNFYRMSLDSFNEGEDSPAHIHLFDYFGKAIGVNVTRDILNIFLSDTVNVKIKQKALLCLSRRPLNDEQIDKLSSMSTDNLDYLLQKPLERALLNQQEEVPLKKEEYIQLISTVQSGAQPGFEDVRLLLQLSRELSEPVPPDVIDVLVANNRNQELGEYLNMLLSNQ